MKHSRMIKPLNVINGEELMDMAYQPIHYVVQNILAQGLTILAGAPKTGKSFLALWLCLCVAKGERLWDFETKQGAVLYLCLEDNNARLQNRLYAMADDAPANLFFCSETETLNHGLEEQIELFLNQHPDTVLVVIDTFQCIRPQGADYSYGNDYKELHSLKNLADRFRVSILLIHHLRKQESCDAFHMISGTTGIQGAADSCFVMTEKERGSGKVRLSILGRDIEKRELELTKDENNVWQKTFDSFSEREEAKDNIASIIQSYMEKENHCFLSGEPAAVAEVLSDSSGENISHVTLLKRLNKNSAELLEHGFSFKSRRSNGRRLIEISRIRDSRDGKIGDAAVGK